MSRLTVRQQDLLAVLTKNLCAPGQVTLSRRQIARETGCSLTTLQEHLGALRDKGRISWEGNVHRGIRVRLSDLPGAGTFVAFVTQTILHSQWDRDPITRRLWETFQLWRESQHDPSIPTGRPEGQAGITH